jgi:carbonic anhydrase
MLVKQCWQVMGFSAPSGVDAASVLETLKQGHQRFLEGHSIHPHSSLARLTEVAAAQHPIAAVLGCADSRIPVELLFDTGLGDLFVVRSAGNTAFTAAIGSLEFAVDHLGVGLIIVLGHARCGAVKAAFDFSSHLSPCLAQVVGQVRMQLLSEQLLNDSTNEPDVVLDRACRANALLSGQNLVNSSVLLTDHVRQGNLRVETGYYNLDTGEIDWLGAVDA